ncbi:uncharacterized protein LOC6556435 [Drosophila grimshawi]|nr:uncharacterized protein LOC6556435 [Drosophila grimshawi]
MLPAHLVLCVLGCITFSGVTHAVYEDCKTPPPVDHARAELFESENINTATYSCSAGYAMKGDNKLICNVETEEWQGEPPACIKSKVSSNQAERKKNMMAIPEEPNVPKQLVQQLDLSCIQAMVEAPEISHGIVAKYERRRRGNRIFLAAYYACVDNYDLERAEVNALYCSVNQWVGELPTCLSRGEYPYDEDEEDDEDYDYAANSNSAAEEMDGESELDESGDPVALPPPPPPVGKEEQVDEVRHVDEQSEHKADIPPVDEPEWEPELSRPDTEPEIVVHVIEQEPEPEPEPKLEPEPQPDQGPVTDINNIVVAPTQDPYSPRVLDENCGKDRGGCAHKCERLLYPGENEPRLKCSCNEGYTLDLQDYARCDDIDECQESNGGCSQICNNLPGSFECACENGYQIDPTTGTTCMDIDECADPELSAKCGHGCENTPGSFLCVKLSNTKQEADEVEEEEEQDNEIDPTPVAQPEEVPPTAVEVDVEPAVEPTVVQPSCNAGFVLSPEGDKCQDINECEIVVEDNENADHVPHRVCQQKCRNTIGSYICSCHEGFHLLDDQSSCASDACDDLDNPQLNRTRCAHQCKNLAGGGYECICPDGYRLGVDLHSCEVLETVCSRELGHERCRPGSCVDSEDGSTFSCLCPKGYTSEVFSCQDVDECAMGTHKCSHDCFNIDGGYQCLCPRGMSLQEQDGHTCVSPDPCAVNNNGCEQLCLSAEGGACTCGKGYLLSSDGKSCTDVDECAVSNGGCQQLCRNLPGSHTCACDRGYELTDDGHSCQDVDECDGLLSGGCTHECINQPGSYECGCPLGYLLQEDERSCRPALVGCPPGTEKTEKGCEPIECKLGMLLGADGSCVDIDECRVNNGGCSHQCRNSQGSYKCECQSGYTLAANSRDCEDVDECEENNGGCEESCINLPGSFKCECAEGKSLSFDERSCYTLPKIKPRVSVKLPAPVAPIPASAPIDPVWRNRPVAPLGPVRPVAPVGPMRPVAPVMPVRPMATLRPVTYPNQVAATLPGIEVRDQCPRFQAPANGQAHCNRYRHKRNFFYNIRCNVRCNPGYQLIGPHIRSCGVSGNWEGQSNQCVPISQQRPFRPGAARFAPASLACPALPAPRNGVISPASCTRGASSFGSSCHLQCNMGFVPVAGLMTSCMNGWSLGSVLECKPFAANMFFNQMSPRLRAPWQQQQQQPFGRQSSASIQQVRRQPLQVQRVASTAYIKCPENVVILLKPHQSRAHVILQRPQTNVDYRHVNAFPAWAKQLQGHLPLGNHKIFFRAHDPVSQQTVGCETIITIKPALPQSSLPSFPVFRPAAMPAYRSAPLPEFRPARLFDFAAKPSARLIDASPLMRRSESLIAERPVENTIEETSPSRHSESTRIDLGSSTSSYCPPSFEVTLKENQNLRSVIWEEPRFEGKLLKIYKSSFPGALFGQGDHDVKYEATTTDGVTLRCNFQIHVKAASSTPPPKRVDISYPEFSSAPAALMLPTHSNLLDGHGSYVICPGKEPVKVTDGQSVNLPVGCTLKNVRPQTKSPTQPKRGLLTSLWRQFNPF